MKTLFLSLGLLCSFQVGAAVLSWQDNLNGLGTGYTISNKLNNGSWTYLSHTTLKSNVVTLVPGTNWFSLTASNGLISDPAITGTNMPSKVFNIIIEAKNDLSPSVPWVVETNLQQFVTLIEAKNFYRIRAEIQP